MDEIRCQRKRRTCFCTASCKKALYMSLCYPPAVSGSQTYRELCLATKNEEKRLATLKKRQKYQQSSLSRTRPREDREKQENPTVRQPPQNRIHQKPNHSRSTTLQSRRCYLCDKPGHLAKDCSMKSESRGRDMDRERKWTGTRQVSSLSNESILPDTEDPRSYLFSSGSEDESSVRHVRIDDEGSHPQCVRVNVQNVPAYMELLILVQILPSWGAICSRKWPQLPSSANDTSKRRIRHPTLMMGGPLNLMDR